ncbi:hypothetical protein [Kingella sp. (in: b-proteobacteria)]|uniref:hypothetical protein n=1 Tax=Kingella sp. (in: b-proteobacteria) TaxID=2020713 RepID=UPI0026DB3D8A|nr:hypothetical protein [Kingella sp. (in: b-proteobacteria)]MDO4658721.1 hypothetical protein [Kingella sp. (in: b-proteobacteria)]
MTNLQPMAHRRLADILPNSKILFSTLLSGKPSPRHFKFSFATPLRSAGCLYGELIRQPENALCFAQPISGCLTQTAKPRLFPYNSPFFQPFQAA